MGQFITFEGGEGSGKTSLIRLVKRYLEDLGYNVLVSREPGGLDIAEQIRGVILNKENVGMDYKTEMLLYAASRREHLVKIIKPYLDKNYIVLCDRFVDSSLVYQGYARGLGFDEVWNLNSLVIENIMPELTIYLDIDPKIGLDRINVNKDREKNRLDLEGLEFHNKVREGYKQLKEKYSERIKEVDASQSLEEVLKDTLIVLNKKFKFENGQEGN